MKNLLLIIMAIVGSFCSGGCGETSQSAGSSVTVPEIAFICVSQREYDPENLSGRTYVTFFSSDGCYYSSDHDPFSSQTFEKMIKDFSSGEGYVAKLTQTCPKEEIAAQCRKLPSIKSELDYPEVMPDVESGKATWYGLYYDENGKLCSVTLHAYDRMTQVYSKDSTANEIYEWYTKAIKLDKAQ